MFRLHVNDEVNIRDTKTTIERFDVKSMQVYSFVDSLFTHS